MSRQLSPGSSLENLRKEAKRWLKALRDGVEDAHHRFTRAVPNAPAVPTLRDVQHALAREHGLPGWTALREALASRATSPRERSLDENVEWFLENACPDHHVRGGPDHLMARHTALRILEQHPEIARYGIHTAAVCGDLAEVGRILAERPDAASSKLSTPTRTQSGVGGDGDRFKRKLGPKGWDPLLFLCFTRLALPAVNENALAIARLLLDRGADPNAYFMAGDSRYTPLVGVIGEGEENRPPHPHRNALTALLLERGAEPYDMQVIYNLGFNGDVLWFLKLIHARATALGRAADWADPEWSMLSMGGYGSGARWHLDIALRFNDLELAEWLLSHGASANARPATDPRFLRGSLHEEAVRSGLVEMARLLERYGATPSVATVTGADAFAAACFRLDRDEARVLVGSHPEYLEEPKPMALAAKQNRADVIGLLLDLGMSPDIRLGHDGQRPLHAAAYANAVDALRVLIARGATVDVLDLVHGGTPLWWAVYGERSRAIEVLSPHSRDVWSLSLTGNVERLRAVLEAEPRLATLDGDGDPPLMYLPGEDPRAAAIVEMFLARGADPMLRNKDGMTAADLAEKRGLDTAARLLRQAMGKLQG